MSPTRNAPALLEALFVHAPVGVAVWDLDLRYQRVNDALAEMNGRPASDHIGRRPAEVLGELGEEVERLLGVVQATGEDLIDQHIEATLPDGRRQVRQTTFFPVLGADGDVLGYAAVARDVTGAHEQEADRHRLLREALVARAGAEAAQVRAESARSEADSARRRTELVARASERLAVLTRDHERTLQEVAAVAVPDLADSCTFTLLDPRGVPRTVAVAGADAVEPGAPARPAPDVAGLDDLVVTPHALIVPLKVGNRTIGALSLAYGASGRTYDQDDVDVARSLAVRAALAVENARLYSERSHIAKTLQRSLLPPALPEVPGLELAARYRAAGDQNDVGGDFYDAFRGRGDGTWTVLIGDVSGKGAEAAALTALTRHTLRAAALSTGEPVASLQLLNDALWAQTDLAGRYCTVLYALVRPDAHGADVRLATGGHQPPAVLRADGRVERLPVRGTIVGGLEDPSFGERRVRLDHGDLLLMFTDGVVELRRRDEHGIDIGDRALEEVLAGHRGAGAQEIVEAVERRAVELQDGEPRDDIALVAMRPHS